MTAVPEVSEAPKFALAEYVAELPQTLPVQQAFAAAYDAACAGLLGPNDIQREGPRIFKKKSAWRKLAKYFGISTAIVEVEHSMVGEFFLAIVTARAIAPWGQAGEAVGACCQSEAVGRRVITIADAIATADTRACNRAISNLIAMGEVSAEEMDAPRDGRSSPSLAPTKRPANGPLWKGRPMADMDTPDLVSLRAWFVKNDPKKWAQKVEEVDETLASRGGE